MSQRPVPPVSRTSSAAVSRAADTAQIVPPCRQPSEARHGYDEDYIHNNPVVEGIVESPEEYLYSSARDYASEKGLVKITRL